MTDYSVEVVTAAESPCAVVRDAVTWPTFRQQWRPMLDDVWAYLRARPEITPGHNVMIYRDPASESDGDVLVEVGVEVPEPIDPAGRVTASFLPAGRAATTVHPDGPATLGAAYDALTTWCDQRGESRTSVRWEVYGDPDSTGDYPIQVSWLLS